MSLGVCYFPEHWPEEDWERDVDRMAEIGVEYVRMAEFSWSRLEPRRGAFQFDWLDEILRRLAAHDIEAVLSTPTAAPPKWLVDERPDIRQEAADGTVRGFGGRRHYCFNSPAFREESDRIVGRLADRYADDPTVVGWQTDNEYGWHGTTRCYCDDCARAFRRWLADRHGSIAALNDAWGTEFWSQRYASFSEIDPPRRAVGQHNPSKLLDFYRFSSDSVVAFNREQVDVLRDANDDWFVTHNFMYDFPDLDAYALGESLDFASWDSYPTAVVQRDTDTPSVDDVRAGKPDMVALNHDLYRTIGGDRFWVMEQQPGDINWPSYSTHPAPGALRLWPQQATAHGAEGVLYFRWRRCRSGQEQYLTGLLDYDGTPNPGLAAAEDVATDLDSLGDLPPIDAPVAILHDYDNCWATGIQPHAPEFDYWEHLRSYYGALRALGVTVDVVPADTDLGGYDAVIAPTLHLVKPEIVAELTDFVEGGGSLLLTMRSGVKDRHNKLLDRRIPGPLADLVGGTVEAFESVPPAVDTRIEYGDDVYDSKGWVEHVDPTEAESRGVHLGGSFEGETAIAWNEPGAGSVLYAGVWPDDDLARRLVSDILSSAGVDALAEPLPDRVRLARRGDYTWVLNFSGEEVRVETDEPVILGAADVEPYGFCVVDGAATELEIG